LIRIPAVLLLLAVAASGASAQDIVGQSRSAWEKCSNPRAFDNVADSCTEVIESKDESPKHKSVALVQRYKNWDLVEHNGKRLDAADLSEAIRLDPTNAEAYATRVNIRDSLDYDRRLADMSEAIRLNPDNADYYATRADLFAEKRDYRRAIDDYSRAIASRVIGKLPRWGFYDSRAELYLELNDDAHAKSDCDEAVRGAQSEGVRFLVRCHATMLERGSPEYKRLLTESAQSGTIFGSDKAPVTVIAYTGMTCSLCLEFGREVFPEIRRKYIETGKVRFILHPVLYKTVDAAIFMLIHCADRKNAMPLVEALYAKSSDWLLGKPADALRLIVAPFGIRGDAFDQCLANQKTLDALNSEQTFGSAQLDVGGAVTIFVNSTRLKTLNPSIDLFSLAVDSYLR
jgi:protein-disulfide isomerase